MASTFSAAGAAGHLTAHSPLLGCAPSQHSHAPAPKATGAPPPRNTLTPETRELLRARIDAERRRTTNAPPADGLVHGTHQAYKKGCRCDECREHQRVGRAARRAVQPPPFVWRRRTS